MGLEMRYCPICETEVEDDDWDREYKACCACAEEDMDYQKHLKQQADRDYHDDLKFDLWRENKYD